jgi:hypothetical protein
MTTTQEDRDRWRSLIHGYEAGAGRLVFKPEVVRDLLDDADELARLETLARQQLATASSRYWERKRNEAMRWVGALRAERDTLREGLKKLERNWRPMVTMQGAAEDIRALIDGGLSGQVSQISQKAPSVQMSGCRLKPSNSSWRTTASSGRSLRRDMIRSPTSYGRTNALPS